MISRIVVGFLKLCVLIAALLFCYQNYETVVEWVKPYSKKATEAFQTCTDIKEIMEDCLSKYGENK